MRKARERRSERRGSAIEKKFVLYEGEFSEAIYRFPGSPSPHPLHISKIVKINVESFSDDELVKRWNALTRKEDWDEVCKMCKMPVILHKGPCTRKEIVGFPRENLPCV